MKDNVHALHRVSRHTRSAQMAALKSTLRAEMLPNVADVAAGQIVDNANFGHSAREKLICERRADEGRPPVTNTFSQSSTFPLGVTLCTSSCMIQRP